MKDSNWIKEVLSGWRLNSQMTTEELARAGHRLNVCMHCPEMDSFLYNKCSLCHCPVVKKAKSNYTDCPKNKWND